jgi:hypothetical protein
MDTTLLQLINTGGLIVVGAILILDNRRMVRELHAYSRMMEMRLADLTEMLVRRMADATLPKEPERDE